MRTAESVPREDTEQECLFRWAAYQCRVYPELQLMYHIPNGGARDRVTGARLKAQGVKRGVPDICLPVARGGKHGLYIELKRQRGGRVSEDQRMWLDELDKQGYAVAVCRGWQEAAAEIKQYMAG